MTQDTASRLAPAASLGATIFCLDAFAGIGGALALLYILVLLAIGDRATIAETLVAGSACAALTIAAFLLHHLPRPDDAATLPTGISLVAIGAATASLSRTRATAARLRASELRYRTSLDTLAIGVWETDFSAAAHAIAEARAHGVGDLRRYLTDNPKFVAYARDLVRITAANETALAMLAGQHSGFATRLSAILADDPAAFADCILAIDERRPIFQAETALRTAAGERIDVIVAFRLGVDATLSRVPASVLDITDRKRLEGQVRETREQLAQVQRASAVAALSASIAHELNQPLSALQSYADAAMRWADRDPPDIAENRVALAGVIESVRYARDVIRRVRRLVGGAPANLAPLDLNRLVKDNRALLRREAIDRGADITFVLAPHPAIVDGDAILLKQVLINLVINALQAMEPLSPAERRVTIEVRLSPHAAELLVADTGPGIPGPTGEAVFETFFTTKPDGMGLGLAICRAAMDSHGGTITLENGPAAGAVARLTLPCSTTGEPSLLTATATAATPICSEERFGHVTAMSAPVASG